MISSPPTGRRERGVFMTVDVERTSPRARLPRDSREFRLIRTGASEQLGAIRRFETAQLTPRAGILRKLLGEPDISTKGIHLPTMYGRTLCSDDIYCEVDQVSRPHDSLVDLLVKSTH